MSHAHEEWLKNCLRLGGLFTDFDVFPTDAAVDTQILALAVLLGVLAGTLIGSAGIGGVIVVPALVYMLGLPVHDAIAATMLAFLTSGVVGTLAYARRGSIDWRPALWLCLAAAPAAFLGALTSRVTPSWLIEATVATLAIVSGIQALQSGARRIPEIDRPTPARSVLAATGTATGFLSAMSGTGGPLVLIPALLWLDFPLLTAVGLAQAVQLPVSVFATAGFSVAGPPPPGTGIALGAGIALGTLAGARLAHTVPHRTLRNVIAAMLITVGVAMLARVSFLQMP